MRRPWPKSISERASQLGREAAEVRGVLDDTQKVASAQAVAVQALAQQLQQVVQSQAGIAQEVEQGLKSVQQVGDAVQSVGVEVGGIVGTLSTKCPMRRRRSPRWRFRRAWWPSMPPVESRTSAPARPAVVLRSWPRP